MNIPHPTDFIHASVYSNVSVLCWDPSEAIDGGAAIVLAPH